jgi:hypothetical protein
VQLTSLQTPTPYVQNIAFDSFNTSSFPLPSWVLQTLLGPEWFVSSIYLIEELAGVNSNLATMLFIKGGKLESLFTFVNSPFSE